jgi:hypothetical protein
MVLFQFLDGLSVVADTFLKHSPQGGIYIINFTHMNIFFCLKSKIELRVRFEKKLITLTEMPQYTQLPQLDRLMPCFFGFHA